MIEVCVFEDILFQFRFFGIEFRVYVIMNIIDWVEREDEDDFFVIDLSGFLRLVLNCYFYEFLVKFQWFK